MRVRTDEKAPPFARLFGYLKDAPGEWIADVNGTLFPFRAIRNAPNAAFYVMSTDTNKVWRRDLSFLLTCADHDQLSRTAISLTVLLRGLPQQWPNVDWASFLLPTLVDFLGPQTEPAEARDQAAFDTKTAAYRSLQGDWKDHTEDPCNKWLERYYDHNLRVSVPPLDTKPVFSYFQPVTRRRRECVLRKIKFYATTTELPSVYSRNPPLAEDITFWNPRDTTCQACNHDPRTCSSRCQHCPHDSATCERLREQGLLRPKRGGRRRFGN
jgi:hypothetical protein